MNEEISCGDMVEASNDGKKWVLVKYLFFEPNIDSYVCLVDDCTCEGFERIRAISEDYDNY